MFNRRFQNNGRRDTKDGDYYSYNNPYIYPLPAASGTQLPLNYVPLLPVPLPAHVPTRTIHAALDADIKSLEKCETWWFNVQWPPIPTKRDPYEITPRAQEILYESATKPPCNRMEIACHPSWSMLIIDAPPMVGCVRVGDVLHGIYEYMQRRAEMTPLSTLRQLSTDDPKVIVTSGRVGFRRIDYLGKRTKFVGLMRLPLSDSMWRLELMDWTKEDVYI